MKHDCLTFSSCRSWQTRKLLWSKKALIFKREDEEKVIESIPFAEVDEIFISFGHKSMTRQFSIDESQDTSKMEEQRPTSVPENLFQNFLEWLLSFVALSRNESPFSYFSPLGGLGRYTHHAEVDLGQPRVNVPVIHVRTTEGSIIGRTYCLQMHDADHKNVISSWKPYIRDAKKRKSNGFWTFQKAARRMYESSPFQLIASALILMVWN